MSIPRPIDGGNGLVDGVDEVMSISEDSGYEDYRKSREGEEVVGKNEGRRAGVEVEGRMSRR